MTSGTLRLSEVELQLSRTLHKPLDYVRPAKVARGLLAKYYNTWGEAEETT